MYELIIIGAGPAGMTAAVYAARKKMQTLLITEDFGGQLMWTMSIENYMGYQYITGPELMEKFKNQMEQYGVEQRAGRVLRVEKQAAAFLLHMEDGGFYEGKTIIIATGKRPRMLNVPGEERLKGRGVSYCATCDGPLFGGLDVAVIGGGNSGVQAALELSAVARQVYLVIRSRYTADEILLAKMQKTDNIQALIKFDILEIKGDKLVTGVVLKNRQSQTIREVPVQGVFVEIGLAPNSALVEGLVNFNDRKEILVDCRCRTNVPGLLAAGDVTIAPEKQIVVAAGEGAKATLQAYAYLLQN